MVTPDQNDATLALFARLERGLSFLEEQLAAANRRISELEAAAQANAEPQPAT